MIRTVHISRGFLLAAAILMPGMGVANLLDEVEVEPGPDRIHHPVKDEDTHKMLRSLVKENDPLVRLETLRAFDMIASAEDEEYIRKMMKDENSRVAAQAWFVAGRQGLQIDAGSLEQVPSNPSRAIRAAMFTALPGLKGEPPPGLIDTGLEDEDPRVRRAAAFASLDSPEKLAPYVKQETDSQVRLEVFRELVKEPNAQRAEMLQWGFDSQDPLLAAAAIAALAPGDSAHHAEVGKGLGARTKAVVDASVIAVGKLGLEKFVDGCIGLLDTPDTSLQAATCRTLGEFPGDGVAKALQTTITRTTDHLVHLSAAKSLLQIHSDTALDALSTFRQHEDARLRALVAEQMGNWGDSNVAERLYVMLDDEDADVLDATIKALLKLKNAGLSAHRERLREIAHTDIGNAAAEAIRALGFIEDRESIPYFSELLKKIEYKQIRAKRDASLEMLQLFDQTNMVDRAYDLITKKVVPPPPAMPMIGPTYDAPEVRMEALRYIARYDTAEKTAAIIDRFDDVPAVDVRIFMLKFMKYVSGEDYVLVPRHSFENYIVESLAQNPYPWVQPPGIRKAE